MKFLVVAVIFIGCINCKKPVEVNTLPYKHSNTSDLSKAMSKLDFWLGKEVDTIPVFSCWGGPTYRIKYTITE